GVRVDLEKAPLKYQGLSPWEIWVSESQERMVLAVPPEQWPALQTLAEAEGVEATVIGAFTNDGKLTVCYENEVVGVLDMDFLHKGMPRIHRKAVWHGRSPELKPSGRVQLQSRELGPTLLKLLAHPNIASKKWVV